MKTKTPKPDTDRSEDRKEDKRLLVLFLFALLVLLHDHLLRGGSENPLFAASTERIFREPPTPTVDFLLNRPMAINQANAAELTLFSGIGPELARRIIAVRREKGYFSGPADLEKVSGIGEKLSHRISRQVRFDAP